MIRPLKGSKVSRTVPLIDLRKQKVANIYDEVGSIFSFKEVWHNNALGMVQMGLKISLTPLCLCQKDCEDFQIWK